MLEAGVSPQIIRREMEGRRCTIFVDSLLAAEGQGVVVTCEGVDNFCPGDVKEERPWRASPVPEMRGKLSKPA